jgi:gentisate 1,2-dioxygenase
MVMVERQRASAVASDQFRVAMKAANTVALWDWYDARANQSVQSEPSRHWRWEDVESLFDGAVAATDMNAAERRVIQLKNPDFPDNYIAVTSNINCGFQILMPGEKARPHRHNMNALRFVVEGTGAATIVDGKVCPMEVGDLIITPAMAWHEHEHNGGNERVVWMDSLDSPLVRHLRCVQFQPGPAHDYVSAPPDSAFASPGFLPVQIAKTEHSPIFRYPWAEAITALKAAPAAADGSRTLRYANPLTGGAVMSLMDCYLLEIGAGAETRPYRSSSNAACLVVEGAGTSTVGDKTIRWGKYDLFTLPAWQWVAHRTETPGARLFQVTDREILRRLDLLRDELAR